MYCYWLFLQRYISYWDCTTEKMFTPPYNVSLNHNTGHSIHTCRYLTTCALVLCIMVFCPWGCPAGPSCYYKHGYTCATVYTKQLLFIDTTCYQLYCVEAHRAPSLCLVLSSLSPIPGPGSREGYVVWVWGWASPECSFTWQWTTHTGGPAQVHCDENKRQKGN